MTQNVSLSKRFKITERLHLDFMMMVSNLFNHPNFNFPGANISTPGQAGVITSQHGFFSDDKSGALLRTDYWTHVEGFLKAQGL